MSSVFPPAKYLARLCNQYWLSEDILPRITSVPILFISGLKDEIIPYVGGALARFRVLAEQNSLTLVLHRPSHMQQLYAVCRAKKKVWKTMPNGTHNDTVAEPYFFNYMIDFINEAS